jgi:hypothetical protein
MTEERKQQILQKIQDKGLCSIDAEIILNRAIKYASNKGEYVIEYYALDLTDLLLSTTFIDKKTGDVKFKMSIDYNTGSTIYSEQ